ncbi:hypothetical protein DFH09DRAFT_1095816 [Mycena vulgaris]|nr:hypothetical protein DFH09DRAFT_1095816 [Mycena vulgaris]
MTGDIGVLDDEGFLYIRERRLKDIIIRGGENVDSQVSIPLCSLLRITTACLFKDGVMEVAAVAVSHGKLGELVAVMMCGASPPVTVLFQAEMPHNAAKNILKTELREVPRREWEESGRWAVAKVRQHVHT